MLVFSAKKGNLLRAMEDVEDPPTAIKFTTYLNVLGIIVLAEPEERFSERLSREIPEVFGAVSSFIQSPELENETDEAEEFASPLPPRNVPPPEPVETALHVWAIEDGSSIEQIPSVSDYFHNLSLPTCSRKCLTGSTL